MTRAFTAWECRIPSLPQKPTYRANYVYPAHLHAPAQTQPAASLWLASPTSATRTSYSVRATRSPCGRFTGDVRRRPRPQVPADVRQIGKSQPGPASVPNHTRWRAAETVMPNPSW